MDKAAPLIFILLAGYIRVNLLKVPIVNLIAYSVIMMVISTFYMGNWVKKLLYILAMTIANLSVDLFLLQLFMLLRHDLQANYYLHGFISTIVRMILIHIIVLQRQPKEWEYDRKIVMIVSGVWAMIVLYALLIMPNLPSVDSGSLRWFFLDTMLMVMSFLIFFLFEISTNKRNAERQVYEITLQMEAQKKYYAQFEYYEKEIRIYKHDMKHFLLGLLASDEREKEKQIRKQLAEIEKVSSIIYTENEVIQLLVQNLLAKVRIPADTLEIHCKAPKELKMEKTDLSVLLGNLFENSAEALAKLPFEKRRLTIHIDYTKIHTRIFLENSFVPVESKHPQMNRGFGIKSIRRIVEKYDGFYSTDVTTEMYSTEIILPFQ